MTPSRTGLLRAVLPLGLAAAVAAGCGTATPAPGPTTAAPPGTAGGTATTAPTAPGTRPAPTLPTPATVVASRVTYPWQWPGAGDDASVPHTVPVPPVPRLVWLGAASHPAQGGERAFDRLSFTFTTGFPGYRFGYAATLVADGSGQRVPLAGRAVLRIVFTPAQAHDDAGAPTIASQPPARLDLPRVVAYAPAGDFEAVLTYGLGVTWPAGQADPRIPVRVSEVEIVTGGQHRYVVEFDVDAG